MRDKKKETNVHGKGDNDIKIYLQITRKHLSPFFFVFNFKRGHDSVLAAEKAANRFIDAIEHLCCRTTANLQWFQFLP